MDPAIQTALAAAMAAAMWKVMAPLAVLLIFNALVVLVFLARQSRTVEQHAELHTEHKDKLNEHTKVIATHATEIAVIKASFD